MDRDRTSAMALSLAKEKLEENGWRYSAEDIGTYAAKIIRALESGLGEKHGN